MNKQCFFISTGWWGWDAPISVHFHALAEELARRGHQVIILVAGQGKKVIDKMANPTVYVWPSRSPTRLADGIFLRGLISRFRPSCLIANFEAVNWMMVLGWLEGIPLRVAWYHTLSGRIDLDFNGSRWKLMALRLRRKQVYRLATHIVAVSSAASQDVQNTFGVSHEKC